MQRLQAEIDDMSRQRDALAEKIETMKDERDRKTEESEAQSTSLIELMAAHDKLRAQIEGNVSENKELVNKVMDVEKLRLEHERKMSVLDDELKNVQDTKAKDIAGLQKQVLTLQEQLELKDREMVQLQSTENQNRKAYLKELQDVRQQVVKSREEAEEYATHLELEVESSKVSIGQAAEDMQLLQTQLDQSVKSMAVQSVKSMAVLVLEQEISFADATQLRSSLKDFTIVHEKLKDEMEQLSQEFALETPEVQHTEAGVPADAPLIFKKEPKKSLRSARPTDVHEPHDDGKAPEPPSDSPYLQMISYSHTEGQVKTLAYTLKEQILRKDSELDTLRILVQQNAGMHTADLASLTTKLSETEEAYQKQVKLVSYVTMQLDEAKLFSGKKQKEAAELQDYATQLESDIQASKERIAVATESIKILEVKNAQNLIDNSSLKGKTENAQQVYRQQLDKTQLLTTQLFDLQLNFDQNKEESRQKSELELTSLREKIKEVEETKADLAAELNKLKNSMKELKGMLQELTKKFEKSKESERKAAAELKTREEQTQQQDEELAAARQDIDRVAGERTALQAQVQALTTDLGELRASAEKKRQESQDYAEHLESEVEASKASIGEAAAALKAREEQTQRQDEELAAARQDIDRVAGERTALQAQVQALTTDLGELRTSAAGKKEEAAEEGGMRRRRIQLEPSGTSGLCLDIYPR